LWLVLSMAWGMLAFADPPSGVLPKFDLVNWDGRRVSADSLKGKTTLLVFTYARCAFACPMVTAQLQELDRELGGPPDLLFAHVSVNPAQDTPEEALRHFEKHDLDPRKDRRWLFLIGPEGRIASALSDFGIEVRRIPMGGDVLIEHTIRVLVVGPAGQVVAAFDTYQWDQEEVIRAIRSALGKG
jgi:protein SCO1/2